MNRPEKDHLHGGSGQDRGDPSTRVPGAHPHGKMAPLATVESSRPTDLDEALAKQSAGDGLHSAGPGVSLAGGPGSGREGDRLDGSAAPAGTADNRGGPAGAGRRAGDPAGTRRHGDPADSAGRHIDPHTAVTPYGSGPGGVAGYGDEPRGPHDDPHCTGSGLGGPYGGDLGGTIGPDGKRIAGPAGGRPVDGPVEMENVKLTLPVHIKLLIS